MRCCLCHRNLF
uniref:Uncharacterized protein n=1 Tax=Arundo donax TaxID=35708 RepID=A0A0A9GPZ3_ARUDO